MVGSRGGGPVRLRARGASLQVCRGPFNRAVRGCIESILSWSPQPQTLNPMRVRVESFLHGLAFIKMMDCLKDFGNLKIITRTWKP